MRLKKSSKIQPIRALGQGDVIAEIKIGRHHCREDRSLPESIQVRVIHYSFDGTPQRLMTSLLDLKRWSADEILKMYHERWEIEIANEELKIHIGGVPMIVKTLIGAK